MTLRHTIAQRPLLLDGAMGSLIQEYQLTEQDFRGTAFADSPVLLKGNNDVLVLTRPDVVSAIHRRYLEAGADLISTCTFSAQRISQHEYHLEGHVAEINRAAVRLARAEADRMTAITPERPRFVLGDVGPTSRMLSMSDNVEDPAARSITFDELEAAYREQLDVLIAEGVDGILMETLFDTLNVKAAISAYEQAVATTDRDIPLLLSCTVSDASGRLLSGQTVEAFVASVAHARPLTIGMNCGLGAADMVPLLRRLHAAAEGRCYVSCHPNAGLPNEMGQYDDTPENMCRGLRPLVEEGIVAVIGGCCGTTPNHISAMRQLLDGAPAPVLSSAAPSLALRITGLEAFSYDKDSFVVVGERCNVAGSRKFLRLISEKKYDEALDIARLQVERGAMVIDINMDDGLLDAQAEMCTFLRLIASDPSICRVPVMVDSSRFEVIEEGLKNFQGKCIVNSISLKQGEELFLEHARIVKRLGAAVIVMCFDEEGQATDYERRIAICQRAYRLLTEKVGFTPSDIIFDPNVLTVATGMAEHANYALDFIRATAWVTQHLPGTRVSGGLSNLSFAFRGNNYLREAMHSVFLHHAIKAGMGMAIMNPATALRYEDIPADLRDAITAVLLNTSPDASERLTELAQKTLPPAPQQKGGEKSSSAANGPSKDAVSAPLPLGEGPEVRLQTALLKGTATTLREDILALLEAGETPLSIISGPLMAGMNEVGRRFGAGQMFLPQVVKTARTMKQAVEVLEPYMNREGDVPSVGKILIATVKGDVHDIGKNIVGVVLACNGFEVIDLGVMVPTETIIAEALRQKVDVVCLSGLITPSLDEMCRVAEAMQQAGMTIPLFVGGATTSRLHTAVKIAPLYPAGSVFHLRDAAQNPVLAMQLLDPAQREAICQHNRDEQQRLRLVQQQKEQQRNIELSRQGIQPDEAALQHRFRCDWDHYVPAPVPYLGVRQHSISVRDLMPCIDWTYFYWAWRVKAESEEARLLRQDAEALLAEMADDAAYAVRAAVAFYPAKGGDGVLKVTLRQNGHDAQCPCCNRTVVVPTPRQSILNGAGERRERCLALCDYVSPKGDDHLGIFAATVGPTFVERLEALKAEATDDYAVILLQTLGDRLAEAAAEYLSRQLAAAGWGGIRPAVGYPSLPDQRTMFRLAEMLDFSALGITLTEHGAMYPQSSVAGLLIAHPSAEYFNL